MDTHTYMGQIPQDFIRVIEIYCWKEDDSVNCSMCYLLLRYDSKHMVPASMYNPGVELIEQTNVNKQT